VIRSRPPAAEEQHLEKRVLVLVAGPRECEVTLQVLRGEGIAAIACRHVEELIERMREGAATALIAEEVLKPAAATALARSLTEQPPWSDFPLIIFSVGDKPVLQDNYALGNVTFLERPVRTRSMLAAVHGALRSRARQYEGRLAIESRDAFLAMLAHELRNPLSAISLAGSLLASRSDGPSKELDVISRQTAHLTLLVDDLLDVARITHGKINLARDPVSLNEVARASFETLQHRAYPHLRVFELNLATPDPYVVGDRQRLEQSVCNLLTNAIKYTPAGGAVRLSVKNDGGVAQIEVSDDGVGIAPSMLSRVFEPFAQVDTSLDRAQGGLGLGLALVQGIVQMHGGSVEARSEGAGRGSSFLVRLPLRSVSPKQTEPEVSAKGQRRLLVVDDNPDIRELLTALLEQAGHQVSTANDGPSGLESILGIAPDVALIDIGLPGFDGFEVARRARAAGSRTKLVAITGYGRAEDSQESRSAGFDMHLVKPVSDSQLRHVLIDVPAPVVPA
jgi:two-component system, sensor histidine kinase